MRKIAIVPALSDSTRVKNKNLLLVDGFPMLYYVIKACKESNAFDDIYINSDDLIFKDMAKQLGVKFYLRNKSNGGRCCIMSNSSKTCIKERCTIHDHFLYDFITSVKCDYLVQVHTTSPLLRPETIQNFCKELETFDSLITSEYTNSESFVNKKPVNFFIDKKQETQSLVPVESICWALSGWKREKFIDAYKDGPTFCGKTGLFPISKIEAIDVDTEEELYIAEACLNHRKRVNNVGKFYYHENITSIESDLVDLISIDGSPIPPNKTSGHNESLMNLAKIEEKIGDGNWCYPVVYTDNDQIAFIRQIKGEGCRKHYHPTKDEWWCIFRGRFIYELWSDPKNVNKKPDKILLAKSGDLVFLPKGTTHIITCVSDEPGVRLACGGRNMSHVYVE